MNLSQLGKGIRIFKKILEAKITNKKIPILAYFVITNKCNLNCFYCYVETQVGQLFEKRKRDMTLNEIKELIDELYDLGTRWICLMGGEPLLRDDIDLIVEYINSKNIFCEMITNGFLIKEKLPILKKIGSLVISLDGDEKGNDLNRGLGSYRKAVEGLDLALAHGIKCRIHCILTRHNKHSWVHAAQLAKERSVPIKFSIVAKKTQSLDPDSFLSDEEIKECWGQILHLKKQGFTIRDSDLLLNFIKNLPFRYDEKIYADESRTSDMPFQCQFGRLSLNIDSDGTFYPCAVLFNSWGVSSKEIGVKNAWKWINEIKCIQCGEGIGGGDISILFSMNLATILNAVKYVLKNNKLKKTT